MHVFRYRAVVKQSGIRLLVMCVLFIRPDYHVWTSITCIYGETFDVNCQSTTCYTIYSYWFDFKTWNMRPFQQNKVFMLLQINYCGIKILCIATEIIIMKLDCIQVYTAPQANHHLSVCCVVFTNYCWNLRVEI